MKYKLDDVIAAESGEKETFRNLFAAGWTIQYEDKDLLILIAPPPSAGKIIIRRESKRAKKHDN